VPNLTIQKSSIIALATFLAADATLSAAGVKVIDWFPTDDKLDTATISIITAGPRQRIWSQPRVVGSSVVSSTTKEYTYRVRSIIQPIQLDLWVTDYEAKRDELEALLDTVLESGLEATLGAAYFNAEAVRDGLLLALDPTNGHEGFVDCVFEDPEHNDTPDAARRGEWRTTIKGELRTSLDIKATSTRILEVILAMKIGEGPLGTAPERTITIDASS
jgi:hypothetical protein